MLNKKEKLAMAYIYEKCEGKESVLITPDELLNCLNSKYDLTAVDVTEIVNALVLEGYITMILSDKKGKPIYCISLEKKGESFIRDLANNKNPTTNDCSYGSSCDTIICCGVDFKSNIHLEQMFD